VAVNVESDGAKQVLENVGCRFRHGKELLELEGCRRRPDLCGSSVGRAQGKPEVRAAECLGEMGGKSEAQLEGSPPSKDAL
jgi:hypothetical protein